MARPPLPFRPLVEPLRLGREPTREDSEALPRSARRDGLRPAPRGAAAPPRLARRTAPRQARASLAVVRASTRASARAAAATHLPRPRGAATRAPGGCHGADAIIARHAWVSEARSLSMPDGDRGGEAGHLRRHAQPTVEVAFRSRRTASGFPLLRGRRLAAPRHRGRLERRAHRPLRGQCARSRPDLTIFSGAPTLEPANTGLRVHGFTGLRPGALPSDPAASRRARR